MVFLKNSFIISFDVAYFTFNIYNLYIMLNFSDSHVHSNIF